MDKDKPDFVILVFPAWIFHEDSASKLLKSISILLESRYSVHIKMVPVSSHGLPQNRTTIILLAMPICSSPQWTQPFAQTEQNITVRDRIGDLGFRNPRNSASENNATALVCSHGSRNIYNHQTGRAAPTHKPINMDSLATDGQLRPTPSFTSR